MILMGFFLIFYLFSEVSNKVKADFNLFGYACFIFVTYSLIVGFLLFLASQIKTIRHFIEEDFTLKYLGAEKNPPILFNNYVDSFNASRFFFYVL